MILRGDMKVSSISAQLLWERFGTYYFPQRIHFRATWWSFLTRSSSISRRSKTNEGSEVSQSHKLKPLLMASNPEQEICLYPGEIIRRIDGARQRITSLFWTLWRTLHAVKRTAVKNVRDLPDAQRILERNLLLSDMTTVSQLLLICNQHKNFTLLYILQQNIGEARETLIYFI